MSKLERLLNLTAALLETHQPLSAEAIQSRVPGYPESDVSFHRAFERDKDDLREMGVPLTLEPIEGTDPPREGYRIPKDQYYLPDPGLEPDELAALHLAATAVRLEGSPGTEALWKLGAPGEPEAEVTEIASLPSAPDLVALFTAVGERRPATFGYHGEERTVDPYRLDFQRGRWYVTGFDHLRGEERSFRVERVEGEVSLGAAGSFERPSTAVPGLRLQPWQLGEDDPVAARLRVDPDQAPVAVSAVGPDAVVDQGEDGSVTLELAVTNVAGFRSFALTFLEHAEVLEPDELREDLVGWLSDLTSVGGR